MFLLDRGAKMDLKVATSVRFLAIGVAPIVTWLTWGGLAPSCF